MYPNSTTIVFSMLLLCSSFLLSAQKSFNLRLLDSTTQQGIPYATIGLKVANTGGTSDLQGHYSFSIQEKKQSDTLIISCIGYKSKIVPVKTLAESTMNSFGLIPLVYEMPEVAIYPKPGSGTLILNPIEKKRYDMSIGSTGFLQQIASFFPRPKNFEYFYLGSVKIFTSSGNGSSFRLRVYENNAKLNGPGADILLSPLIVQVKEHLQQIDLSHYRIEVPENGFYVAVEWLKIKENIIQFRSKKSETIIAYEPYIKSYRVSNAKELTSWSLNYKNEWQRLAAGFNLAIEVILLGVQ